MKPTPPLYQQRRNPRRHTMIVWRELQRALNDGRMVAGSDCGVGTFAGYGKLDRDISFKKLGAIAERAAIASKRLWRQ
jgi:5-methyltetrahydropteroyltriglutamate--homocysteine methyltransferase